MKQEHDGSTYGAHPGNRPCELAPLEAFSNTLAPDGTAQRIDPYLKASDLGRTSKTVQAVLASRCCEYPEPPSADELYEAMRRMTPTERDRFVMGTWIIEATIHDWLRAWTEQAYSWRMLARPVQLTQYPCWDRIRSLNTLVDRPDLIPPGSAPGE